MRGKGRRGKGEGGETSVGGSENKCESESERRGWGSGREGQAGGETDRQADGYGDGAMRVYTCT